MSVKRARLECRVRRASSAFALGLGFLVVGCAVITPLAAQGLRTRDSAGVRVTENASRATAPIVFVLSDKPTMEVGGLESDPAVEFNHRGGFLRGVKLSDGALVVIDGSRVHFFDPAGVRVRIVGRNGSGPGEFRYLTSICRARGDTVVVADGHTRRVTVMDHKGKIVRELPDGTLGALPPDGCLADGFIRERLEGPRSDRPRTTITRFRLDGSIVATYPAVVAPPPGRMKSKRLSLAAGGNRVYLGTGETSQVSVAGPDGKIIQVIRTDDAAAPSSSQARRGAPPTTALPAYGQFHIDPAGRLWMRDYVDTGIALRWTAFDAGGRMLGRLVFPAPTQPGPPLQVINFGRDEVVVRRFDSNGATYLSVFQIKRMGRIAP